MATLAELQGLQGNNGLLASVEGACFVAADTIRTEGAGTTNHTERLRWANLCWNGPALVVLPMLRALLGANKAASESAIQSASDASIQANVDAAVDVFALQIPAP